MRAFLIKGKFLNFAILHFDLRIYYIVNGKKLKTYSKWLTRRVCLTCNWLVTNSVGYRLRNELVERS